MDFSSNSITDDELAGLISSLPKGVNLEIILDCCHSGTGTRELQPLTSPTPSVQASQTEIVSFEEFTRPSNVLAPRYAEPPFDVTFHLNYNPDLPVNWIGSPLKVEEGKEIVKTELNHTLWAGCRENQVSWETQVDGQTRGIFTYSLCEILRKRNGQIPREEAFKLLNAAIQRSGYRQNPQLDTSKPELRDTVFV